MNYCKDRIGEVVALIGQRLTNIQRFESAAEIYEACNYFEKAIECFIQIKKFDRATECASQVRPMEMQQMLMEKINQHKKDMYIADGNISKLVKGGDMSGLEMLASRGQWEECLSLAEKQGPDFLNQYLMKFAKVYLNSGQFKETARTITKYGSPAIQQMLPVYKTIAVEILASVNSIELEILREMLQKLMGNIEESVGDRNSAIYQEFHKYLMVTHLLLLKDEVQKNRLDKCFAKLSTSLLRYCRDVRADKAFLDAGEANRKINNNDMAVIFLNRYIDLYDAIEDPENNGITENTEFENTDIPSPYDISLPEKNVISADARQQILDWVLEVNMDGNVGQNLPCRQCEYCNYDGLYEAALHCPQCNSKWEPCIVTGYPLVKT